MTNDKLEQLFSQAQKSEPYLDAPQFSDAVDAKIAGLDWPPSWLRIALPLVGFSIGLLVTLQLIITAGVDLSWLHAVASLPFNTLLSATVMASLAMVVSGLLLVRHIAQFDSAI